MTSKNIFSSLIIAISVVFYLNFVQPFKEFAVDGVRQEYENLQTAFDHGKDQLSLKNLKQKKQDLTLQETNVLENFVPQYLKSGTFVYNLAQFANQNRLTIKNIQYTVLTDELKTNPNADKKIMVEFTLDGKYEDFVNWLSTIEKSNILINIENIRGLKTNGASDTITFNVKLISFAKQID